MFWVSTVGLAILTERQQNGVNCHLIHLQPHNVLSRQIYRLTSFSIVHDDFNRACRSPSQQHPPIYHKSNQKDSLKSTSKGCACIFGRNLSQWDIACMEVE